MTKRPRLTYANVMTMIGLFLLVAGGTAIAAKQLGKKTVGAKQLKSNAVTTAKIKKAAVTKAKIKDGAIDASKIADGSVTTSKIADGAVTGAKINAASTPFSQIVAKLRSTSGEAITFPATLPVGSYTQQPGEDSIYLGTLDINFAASCSPPRVVLGKLLMDAPNPAAPLPADIVGSFILFDQAAGSATKRVSFGPGEILSKSTYRASPLVPTSHSFDVRVDTASCSEGSGISVFNAGVDVISTK